MKNYIFKVRFADGAALEIRAATPMQAVILAMAERIRNAKPWSVDAIEDERGKRYVLAHFDLKLG